MEVNSLEEYFNPVSDQIIADAEKGEENTFGRNIQFNTYDPAEIKKADIVIFGVEEDRNAKNNWGCSHAPDFVRSEMYKLFRPSHKQRVIDLGNMNAGLSVTDTYYGLAEICKDLKELAAIPIILGGSQDLSIAQFMGAEAAGTLLEFMTVDSKVDMFGDEQEISTPDNFLNHLFLNHSNNLFHFVTAGYQEYLNDPGALQALDNVFFETVSLGELRADIAEFEPYIRSIDLLSFDMSAIRFSDAPGVPNANANGLFAHEACQIARYAGIAQKLSSIGFYNFNPTKDPKGVTASLLAQMVWYFVQGYYARIEDLPPGENNSYIKYLANIKHLDQEIIFYRSKKSDRWWMEIPIADDEEDNKKCHILPCSYSDYRKVCLEQDLPDKWLRAQKKFAKNGKS